MQTSRKQVEMIAKLVEHLAAATDWLLIVVGILLVVKGGMAIDVPVARYGIMGVGSLLAGCGFWYRHRRKQRRR